MPIRRELVFGRLSVAARTLSSASLDIHWSCASCVLIKPARTSLRLINYESESDAGRVERDRVKANFEQFLTVFSCAFIDSIEAAIRTAGNAGKFIRIINFVIDLRSGHSADSPVREVLALQQPAP